MISVEHLSRSYGAYTAVDQVSFEIHPGEIVGLLGHNGAGKTTIMKMLTGYLEPSAGSIQMDGLNMASQPREIQKKIGYLPENCPLYLEMNILSYLDYCASLHGIPALQRPALIREAVERTALTEKATEQIAKLSRGYRQRTGVAQAILHHPSILILDEPTNGLDPTQIGAMRRLIQELAQTATVLISTHILQEVQAVCDRVLIIQDGKLALDARLDQLQADKSLQVSTNGEAAKALALFQSLAQLRSVRQTGEQDWVLQFQPEADHKASAALCAKAIMAQNWELYALNFESRSLETVFAEISAEKEQQQ
jgi:ABC-2 type transport system ATP-binding protein